MAILFFFHRCIHFFFYFCNDYNKYLNITFPKITAMLEKIIEFSIRNKLIVFLFTLTVAAFGIYAVFNIPVGAVPDITNNQVQVITTSGNLSTQEIEQYITAPVEMEMANLPGVKEIRSVSKFGISLVTIVFDESMGPTCLGS